MIADSLVRAILSSLRQPAFYTKAGIEDSLDGRFRLLQLLLALLFYRLAAKKKRIRRILEKIVKEVDGTYREIGVGDMKFARVMRKSASMLMTGITRYHDLIAGTFSPPKEPNGGDADLKLEWKTVLMDHLIDQNVLSTQTPHVFDDAGHDCGPFSNDDLVAQWVEQIETWHNQLATMAEHRFEKDVSKGVLFPVQSVWIG